MKYYEIFSKTKDTVLSLVYDTLRKIYFVRPMTSFMQNRFNGNSVTGLEIGVQCGFNSMSMFKALNIKKLYLVDPWDNEDHYQTAMKMLSPFKDKIEIIKKFSEDAASDVKEELDFVYIDGNHDYEFVKKDIELYYPLIKKGGIIGGDDFSIDFVGVAKAVIEFADKKNLKINGGGNDWWFIKN